MIFWLMFFVGDKIDPKQYGGQQKTSITHYLIDLINFVLYNHDLKIPQFVLACLVDFSKAFNRQNHNLLITLLSDMGVPGWLLSLVMAFLEDRSMILRFKGSCSSSKPLPGGGPQGTILGLFLFLILINSAGFDDIQTNIGEVITKVNTRRKPLKVTHEKYVDDLTILEAIDIKKQVQLDPNPNPTRPVPFHLRTGHYLPAENSLISEQLGKLERYAEEHEMRINCSKTKLMLFNKSRTADIQPELYVNKTRNS